MSILRSLLIAVLMILAIFFLAEGLGIPVPHLQWRGYPARDISIGILLVFAGIAVARFWTIPQDESRLIDDWKRHRKQR
jgi:uncharacterized membrane protein